MRRSDGKRDQMRATAASSIQARQAIIDHLGRHWAEHCHQSPCARRTKSWVKSTVPDPTKHQHQPATVRAFSLLEPAVENTKTNNLTITKDRVKAWRACGSGYRWFLEKFPQGGEFAQVYKALQADKRYDDSTWLADRVFAELDAPARVQ